MNIQEVCVVVFCHGDAVLILTTALVAATAASVFLC